MNSDQLAELTDEQWMRRLPTFLSCMVDDLDAMVHDARQDGDSGKQFLLLQARKPLSLLLHRLEETAETSE